MSDAAATARALRAAESAHAAPFVRHPLHVALALRIVLAAATPCALMALYNTGHQINLALAAATPASGWRTRALGALGLGHSPASVLDCTVLGALFFLPLLAATWLAAAGSQAGFARVRGRPADSLGIPVVALLFALSLPPTLPLWQAALGCAIGVCVGREIFGGFGFNFVNPVVAGLGFLTFAYPGALTGDAVWVPVPGSSATTPLAIASRSGLEGLQAAGLDWSALAIGRVPGAMGETSLLACLIGMAVMLGAGVASWRIVAGACLGLLAGVAALQAAGSGGPVAELPPHWHIVTGSFAFGIVFLATDPVTSATTNPGRWLYGGLIGLVVAVVRLANPAYQEGVLLALLIGNVCAPLLDRLVGLAQLRWNRATRRG